MHLMGTHLRLLDIGPVELRYVWFYYAITVSELDDVSFMHLAFLPIHSVKTIQQQ